MSTSRLLENYDVVEPMIRKLYDSKQRLAILEALSGGPKQLSDLWREVGANAPNTSTRAKDLEEMSLIRRDKGEYRLTRWGEAVLKGMDDSLEFYSAYWKFRELWDNHIKAGIPEHLWADIGALNNSVLIKNDSLDYVKVHEVFLKFFGTAKTRFYAVAPIFNKDWLLAVENLARNGVDTRLILKTDVIVKGYQAATDSFKEVIELDNLKLYEIKEARVAFAVTDSALDISLPEKEGAVSYMDMCLESDDPRAVQWGRRLFDYYKSKAKPLDLESIIGSP